MLGWLGQAEGGEEMGFDAPAVERGGWSGRRGRPPTLPRRVLRTPVLQAITWRCAWAADHNLRGSEISTLEPRAGYWATDEVSVALRPTPTTSSMGECVMMSRPL